MSAPYWGDLPGPKVSARPHRRAASDDYASRAPGSRRQSLDPPAPLPPQSKQDRASTQTDLTLSPYATPRDSFQDHGLAPRPASQSHYPPDIMEKRRRRASKNREEEDAYAVSGALPPPAPDAPKGPPVSYKHPYGNGGLPYTLPRAGEVQQSDFPPSPGVLDPDYYKSVAADRTKHSSTNSGRRASSASAAVAPRNSSAKEVANGQRKSSLGSEVDRRLFADTRSPLQRLELTLDSITKEEKRARVEAAERHARERAASRGAEKDGSHTPTVRFQDDADTESGSDSARNQIQLSSRSAKTEEPQRKTQRQVSQPRKSPKSKAVSAPSAQEAASSHRNLSFRERAARNDISLPNGGSDSPATPPVTSPGSGYSLARQGSNKLKKDPPGDPWYQRRTQAEQKYGYAVPGPAPDPGTAAAPALVGPPNKPTGGSMRNRVPPLNTAVARRPVRQVLDNDDDLESPVTTGKSVYTAKHGQSSVLTRTPPHSPFPLSSSRPQNASPRVKFDTAAVAGNRHPGVPASDSEGNLENDHHMSEFFHRHEYRPGQGLYKPPKYLSEWKKGTVGTLSGTMLELSGEVTPTADKGQTWWETPPSQRRGSVSTRPRKAEAFDGEYDETNGTQTSDDSTDPGEVGQMFAWGHRQSWSVHYDDMVPLAREFMGHQVTADKRKARRQTRLYSIGRPLVTPGEEGEAVRLSTLCSCLPCFTPSHARQLSEHTLLTRAARMAIRVPNFIAPTRFKPPLYLKCGPLLRYCGMRSERITSRSARNGPAIEREFWRGTVMIATADEESSYDIAPTLRLFAQPLENLPPPPAEVHGEVPPEYVDPAAGLPKLGCRGETLYVRPVYDLDEGKDHSRDASDNGLFEKRRSPPDIDLAPGATDAPGSFSDRKKRSPLDGEKTGKYKDIRGYRLHAERGCTFWRFNVEVELRDQEQRIAYRINRGPATGFWVPAKGQSMNIMFHSCNGFSLSVNPDELSGPDPLWRDVLNNHQSRPFHVMIGGGDQLYCDAVMRQTKHFQDWLMIRNPLHKHNAPFSPEMQDELEAFYLERYCMWFSQGLFGLANSQIPMVNMYDDHDIIDGFGSYPHHFMTSPVFSGLGNVAFKYYMLFQHQTIPDETEETESSWAMGLQPGPYIHERSRSLFMHLGSKIALLAVDTRTERTRDQVVRLDTWEKLMDRCYNEIIRGKTEHLLVLLGVPIAYPRLVWLENILTSRLLDPIKALGKTGLFGNVFNKFDGGVEVLDDLDDHWTAKNHKEERKLVLEDLQDLAADKSVRITILSGDVHLAAIGQFYSNPKLELAKHKDFRYMPNIISSAIVNTPPPDLMADVLNKRNKVHHLDKDTDEDMIPMFGHGVEGKPRNNKRLLPHRNWCSIREYTPGQTPPSTPPESLYEENALLDSPGARNENFINRGITRRLSKRNRGTAFRADVIDSKPPISSKAPGGLFRTLSNRGRRSDGDVPRNDKRPSTGRRTLSLTRGDFSMFRRGSKSNKNMQPDDGGINGTWGDDSDPEYDDEQYERIPERNGGGGFLGAIGLRGGGGSYEGEEFSEGDDSYFTARAPANTAPSTSTRPGPSAAKAARLLGEDVPPVSGNRGLHTQPRQYGVTTTVSGGGPVPRAAMALHDDDFRPKPFHRTPTSASVKQATGLRRTNTHQVNVQGGLDICLNVEVSAKDPAGITVPYRLLVPRLWYDAAEGQDVELPPHNGGGLKRLLSLNRGKSQAKGKGLSRDMEGQGQGQRAPLMASGGNGNGVLRPSEAAPGTAF